MNIVIILAVIAVIGALLVACIKSESKGSKTIFVFIMCFAWFGLGCYSAITATIYYTTHSSTVGQIEEHDPYEDFNFYEYIVTDFALAQADDGSLYYEKNYATSIEFDGTDKNYTLLLNNKPCENTASQYGRLNANTIIHYDDVDGSYKCGISLDINFTFYSSHIILRIKTSATLETANLLTEYVAINGFELRIIDEVYTGYPVLSDKAS